MSTPTYSAGLLKVGNLTATGTSATLEANTATVTNATITNLNTTNLVGVSGNLALTGKVYQASAFATPSSGVRSEILMSGKDYNCTNYQSATDGSGMPLPFFNLIAQGTGKLNLPQFGAFCVEAPTGGNPGFQQTFQGVCDKEYVYMIWEPYVKDIRYWTGTDLADWLSLTGFATDWNFNSALIVKIDRSTGQIVKLQNIGLMADTAYIAAGATKELQESVVGPCPYVADASGNPVKDASGNYVTTAVTGIDKTALGYSGFQTINPASWALCGDDNARGPFHLYHDHILDVNCLYLCSTAQKYTSVYKIRADTLTMIWRRTTDPMYLSYENPQLSVAGRVMRVAMVIPPGFGRSYPVVVTGSTDNFSYGAVDMQDIQKLFNFYKSGGSVQAWGDFGLTAGNESDNNTNTPMWQTLLSPSPLAVGDALQSTFFRQTAIGAPMLTVNGITETQDSSGFIRDSDGNVSIEVYAPLVHGYRFRDGNPNTTDASGCKTSGTFTLATGRQYNSFLNPAYSLVQAVFQKTATENPAYLMMLHEIARFQFLDGTIFDMSGNYTGLIQNGPNVGTTVTVSGFSLLCGINNASYQNFLQTNPVQHQPLIKKIYLAQVGRAVDQWEVSELNPYGGGCYLNFAYDVDTDTIITPTGQMVHFSAGIDKLNSKLLLSDVSYNGIFYPGVLNSFSVNDESGNVITNSYKDDSGIPHIDTTFYGGKNFFRGIDGNGAFTSYVPYASDMALKNLNSMYVRIAVNNYYYSYSAGFAAAGLCDSSGFLINNIATNPKCWCPGADSSGIVSERAQASFILNRQQAYWKKACMIRDAMNLGQIYNRQGASGFSGFKVSNGALKFSINTHGADLINHSTDSELYGGHIPIALFKNMGYNTDGISVSIVRGLTDISGNQRKLLACNTKQRIFLLDFKKLVDSSGTALTLSHVDGDTSIDYKKGCKTNSWKDALLYEGKFGAQVPIATINSAGTDANNGGNNYLAKACTNNFPGVVANFTDSFVPGKEIHGYNMPKNSNYWTGPPSLFGNPVSDAQLQYGMASLWNYVLSPTEKFYVLNGVPISNVQWNTLIVTCLAMFGVSFNGKGGSLSSIYNLQTILNNSITNPTLNTPQNVLKYQFGDLDTDNSSLNNSGTQIYGNVVLSGNHDGILEVYNIDTGYPINEPNPEPGTYVPSERNANIGVYNPEGQRVPPLIIDGCMYGWGGANKWVVPVLTPGKNDNTRNPTKLFMWTPYGK